MHALFGAALSPDGKTLATYGGGNKSGDLRLWDLATAKERVKLQGHASIVSSAAFSADGKKLISGSFDRTVKIWDARTGKLEKTIAQKEAVRAIACSPNGKLLATGYLGGSLKVWSIEE